MRIRYVGIVLIVATMLMSSGEATEKQFCKRAEASRRCAIPPTVDEDGDFRVEEYLGKWYEIGSTASFKLLTEAGLLCNQARYSASPAGNLSLLNSGLRVISSVAVAEVAAINVAARGACAAARQVCHQLVDVSQLSRSLATLHGADAQLLHVSQQLTTSAQAAQQALDNLSQDVTFIQQANGQISQASPSSSLQSSVAAIKQYAKEGEQEQVNVASLVSTLNKISSDLADASHKSGWSEKSRTALQHAALSLASIALKVGGSSTAMELSLKAVGVGAKALAANGRPVKDASVSFVSGSITQPNATSAAAKLEVSIIGNKAPYWIIGLEKSRSQGGSSYSAALVYSCSEVAGVAAKSLFVLSREPQLQRSTLDAFLAKAESLGIYNDCEDPFLLTVQRGGDCGQPSSR